MHCAGSRLDISVVTHNSAERLGAFFDSLLGQRLPLGGISLYLRDNGSSDGTPALLRDFARRHAGDFRTLRIETGPNLGFGAGHHRNWVQGEAEFILLAHPDVTLEPDCLELLLREAACDAPQTAAWECRQRPAEHPKDYHPASGDTEWNAGGCVLYRRAALHASGGYEPCLSLRGADAELSYRLRALGYRLRYVPRAAVWRAQAAPASMQAVEDAVANVLLRCRYGGPGEAVRGMVKYLRLFRAPRRHPGQRARLAGGLLRLLRLAPRFLLSRRGGLRRFAFSGLEYGAMRDDARGLLSSGTLQRQPLVSVLVRTMPGRGGCLREALASVAGQTYAAIHLVVVEDGGDSARAQLEAARASGRFREVSYLALPKGGRCAAGNAALAAARGELMCFLDDDDLLYADHLEVLVAAWTARPELGAVCAWALEVRTRVLSREPWVYEEQARQVLYRQAFDRALLWRKNYLPIQSVLFQRKLFEQHGGFDPELEQLEDWNLWVRYSLRHAFEMVPRGTSLFRVPAEPEQARRRRAALESYYAVAQAKHARLLVEAGLPAAG